MALSRGKPRGLQSTGLQTWKTHLGFGPWLPVADLIKVSLDFLRPNEILIWCNLPGGWPVRLSARVPLGDDTSRCLPPRSSSLVLFPEAPPAPTVASLTASLPSYTLFPLFPPQQNLSPFSNLHTKLKFPISNTYTSSIFPAGCCWGCWAFS